jgi:hypothetical protein
MIWEMEQAVLAFAVALVVTGLELITTEYPMTPSFVLKSIWYYLYVVIYGVIASVIVLILPLIADQATVSGVGVANPWIKAAVVGLAIKSFLHIRLFTVSTGPGSSFPVGIETIVQLFEPWMLRSLEIDHWNMQQAFVTARAARIVAAAGLQVAAARAQASSNIPTGTKPAVLAAFNADITAAGTPSEVIIVYMKYFGTAAASRVFP